MVDFFFFLIPIFQTYIFLSFLLSFFFHPSLPPPLFPPHPRFLSFFLLFFFFFFHLSFLSFLQHRKVYCRAKQREGFLGGSVVSNAPANAGDTRGVPLIPGSGRSLGEGNGNPLQYSCLGSPMDRGARWATDHGVAVRHD